MIKVLEGKGAELVSLVNLNELRKTPTRLDLDF